MSAITHQLRSLKGRNVPQDVKTLGLKAADEIERLEQIQHPRIVKVCRNCGAREGKPHAFSCSEHPNSVHFRSTITGRFVTEAYAAEHPDTTIRHEV